VKTFFIRELNGPEARASIRGDGDFIASGGTQDVIVARAYRYLVEILAEFYYFFSKYGKIKCNKSC
jgi:hypothetical protein